MALDRVVKDVQPVTLLARVQMAWLEVAGAVTAAEAEPVSDREGVVTVACSSATWAQELELLGPTLVAGLNAHPALVGGPVVQRLRPKVGSAANRGGR
jgi:predicted nucleic acid-binding Zn ribbon protein